MLDGGGGVKETRDYYPFGLPMPGRYEKRSPPTQEDFTGHVKDGETELHYAGARYCSSAFGRWLKPDPILGEKGPKALLKQDARLLAMTSYNYAFGSPATLTDPTGLAPMDWYRDEEGNIVHDEDVQSQEDLEEGQTYLGENVLQYKEGGPTRLGTREGDWVDVFDESMTEGEAGAKGASGLSVAAARQNALLTSEGVKGGKALSELVKWTGRVAKGATFTSFALSQFSEVSEFARTGDFGTHEGVKLGADLVSAGVSSSGIGAAVAFGAEVSGGKRLIVRQITLEILESQVSHTVGPDPTWLP